MLQHTLFIFFLDEKGRRLHPRKSKLEIVMEIVQVEEKIPDIPAQIGQVRGVAQLFDQIHEENT